MRAPDPGLCGSCVHVKRIESRKGSVFHMCLRSKTDPRFRQYPPIPVFSCIGYEPPSGDGRDGGAAEPGSDG